MLPGIAISPLAYVTRDCHIAFGLCYPGLPYRLWLMLPGIAISPLAYVTRDCHFAFGLWRSLRGSFNRLKPAARGLLSGFFDIRIFRQA
jgi:hypothetical protein